ncbi:MAG: hypothetical protein IT373_36910 [Polyangiaceae bacterium]|nr:hypothetical protein [Polyangiaceae bacterium]
MAHRAPSPRESEASSAPSAPRPARGRGRAAVTAVALYVCLTAVFFALAPRDRLASHSPYNHYALQADAWLHGRLDLGGPPPAYTGHNDFASYGGKWFVSFGPVPAALLVPFAAAAGSAERVRDAQVFVALAAVGPALLYLVLDELRRRGRSGRSDATNLALAALFALGTVYWFTAEQGTVWFAGHVVAVACLALYALASIGGAHPIVAGVALGLAVGTRPNLLFAAPFFLWELGRAAGLGRDGRRAELGPAAAWRGLAAFLVPLGGVLAVLAWHNAARFGDPFEFGHRYLDIAWRPRIDKWGLFSLHYLGRNLGVVLSGLPFWTPGHGPSVNAHGLALWLTSPFYVYALWPRRTNDAFRAAAIAAACVAVPNLLYQNTGWIQFGYRFSNDFAPFLMILVATGGRRLGLRFWLLGAVAVAVNAFGAVTFDRREHAHFYFVDGTQRVLHQPD